MKTLPRQPFYTSIEFGREKDDKLGPPFDNPISLGDALFSQSINFWVIQHGQNPFLLILFEWHYCPR